MNSYFYPIQRSQPIGPAKAVFYIVPSGTGSGYEIGHAREWVPYLKSRVSFVFDDLESVSETTSWLDVRTAHEHIENIRHVFNIPISDLANFFDVSRQAIYKWLTGSSIPEKEKFERIISLSQIADQFREANIIRAGALLKMKTFHGRSLLDLLITGEYTTGHITSLIKEARIMEASHKESGLLSSKAKPTSDWQSSVSIPGSTEET